MVCTPLLARVLAVAPALFLWLAPADAGCKGGNLIEALPPADRAALEADAAAAPFAEGLLWQAMRGEEVIILLGTYHLDDPRHGAIMDRILPLLAGTKAVMVEAGPAEVEALKTRLVTEPDLILNPGGGSLRDQLPEDDWQALAAAMAERGVPPFMAARFRPFYVIMVLGMLPCMTEAESDLGLDGRIMAAAAEAGLPVTALEPYDTLLTLFDGMTMADQIGMIRSALASAGQAEEFAATLADSYFAERPRLAWALTRFMPLYDGQDATAAAAEFARMEEVMMTRRNHAWIAPLTKAAAEGPVFAAFGALHLSGEDGVLALLQAEGFTIRRLPLR